MTTPEELGPLPKVELRICFIYDCPFCGQENLVRIVEYDSESAQSDHFRSRYGEEFGVEVGNDVEWASVPGRVKCRACKTQLATELPEEYENDEDWS